MNRVSLPDAPSTASPGAPGGDAAAPAPVPRAPSAALRAAARHPRQRPAHARLLVVPACGGMHDLPRHRLVELLRPGDLVIANDAATLPASLAGTHQRSGAPVELRLAGRASLDARSVRRFTAVLFGAGDWRTPTEDRPPPPTVSEGDHLALGPLRARVERHLGHARLLRVQFEGRADAIWAGLARHGRPVQYAYLDQALRLWDVWTQVAAHPVAFEPPSAGFVLDWGLLAALRRHDVGFATLTHAAGLSSTGDAGLDRRLPLPEPYHLPLATLGAIDRAREQGGRVVAVGTTVTRALEDSAARHGGRPRAGPGVARLRLGPGTRLHVVDVLLSGTHDPGTSHYDLLRAFADQARLQEMTQALRARGYHDHEFGDSVWLERACAAGPAWAAADPTGGQARPASATAAPGSAWPSQTGCASP